MKAGFILLLSLGLIASSVEYYYFLASAVAPVRLCGNPEIENGQIILDVKGDETPAVRVHLKKSQLEKFERELASGAFYSVCVFSETWPQADGEHFVIEAHHYAPLSPQDTVSGFSVGNH